MLHAQISWPASASPSQNTRAQSTRGLLSEAYGSKPLSPVGLSAVSFSTRVGTRIYPEEESFLSVFLKPFGLLARRTRHPVVLGMCALRSKL